MSERCVARATDAAKPSLSARISNTVHPPGYVVAPSGWDWQQVNPFANDGRYGPDWSFFQILDRGGTNYYNGSNDRGMYALRAERDVAHLNERLADWIRYETRHGRTVIVQMPLDVDAHQHVTQCLHETPAEHVVRAYDPRWVVHSTSLASWERIRACGELCSYARLQRAGYKTPGVGFWELGEPDDYAEHIMVGTVESLSSEHVVSSQQKGVICTKEHTPYTPGARLYFDLQAILRDRLGVRDGAHVIKVHERLPLMPYLVAAIDVAQVDPLHQVGTWTPNSFLGAANARFYEIIADSNGPDAPHKEEA